MSNPTWQHIDDGVYSNGTYEARRCSSTARSRSVWVLFTADGEPVTRQTRYGSQVVAGDTLAEAKRLAAKRTP